MFTTYPSKILSRRFNKSDGSQSLFLDIAGLDGDEDFAALDTDPAFGIEKIIVREEGKPILEIRLSPWTTLQTGDTITLKFPVPMH